MILVTHHTEYADKTLVIYIMVYWITCCSHEQAFHLGEKIIDYSSSAQIHMFETEDTLLSFSSAYTWFVFDMYGSNKQQIANCV
jgi:hypothetical protein